MILYIVTLSITLSILAGIKGRGEDLVGLHHLYELVFKNQQDVCLILIAHISLITCND